jgi:hypothetical protein
VNACAVVWATSARATEQSLLKLTSYNKLKVTEKTNRQRTNAQRGWRTDRQTEQTDIETETDIAER